MVFIKHNYLKSDIFFKCIAIPHFQDSCFSEFRFGRIQIFQGTVFSGSESRVPAHVLEVANFRAVNLLRTFLNLMKQEVATKSQ